MKRFQYTHFSKVAFILFILVFVVALDTATAQCPMCRMSLESNLKNGGTQGRGINAGILYLLSTPYLIVGGLAYAWWRGRKKASEKAAMENLEA